MAREILGDQIDIHTGGIDHIPVHHTNEIAQTEAVTSKRFSNFWVHANHIKVSGTKMSKSLGNIFTLQDILDKGYDIQAFKLLVLSKHYRTEGNFTWGILDAAQNRLNNWQAAADLQWQTESQGSPKIATHILKNLQDDMDTPGALAGVDHWFSVFIDEGKRANHESITALIKEVNDLLGINLHKPDITAEQKQLIKEREDARLVKDWELSDKLRDQLKEQRIEVRDTPEGTIWQRV